MNITEIIRALKTDVSVGQWNTGHVSRSAFPISSARAKNYKFGSEYKWRVVKFDCLNRSFRILILLNEAKQIYRATLGIEVENEMAIICQHEFHASEPGWHCHVTMADDSTLPIGVVRQHLRRWPASSARHSRMEFGVSMANAVSLAAARFRVSEVGPLV